ncbi:MAG: alpha/beta hydrolase-fold protein [Prosthecochloris sp.]|uniref:Esterase n=1 Tax=Prosthecochloris aestuarii (strain DSM 271 / SK 413) TaxID=290512 RepID=B4S834_PROA2|nr:MULTISPECIES: alpha/beta hydrolase-fold protein [Prosthecochloris]ACF46221.1 putative esterase [Prosthecochloris aestuarii DSM 271]MCW8799120.1 alpha/beta hydrolase-fold protein [Prosthecochloris sp.]
MINHRIASPGMSFPTAPGRTLQANPLGDPCDRTVPVFLPPSYDGRKRFPVIYLLSGFASTGASFLNFRFGRKTVPQQMEELMRGGSMKETILVMPDCMTRYGGSQYVDSAATGAYETYLTHELVNFIDSTFKTLPEKKHRAIAGKSSGGFGALRLSMRHPDKFHATACHSGDMHFDLSYRSMFPSAAKVLEKHDGSIKGFFHAWEKADKKPGSEFPLIDIMAMAACYSPDPAKQAPENMRLPFNPYTCDIIEEIWQEWLAFDPLLMLEKPSFADALKNLELLYLDCGSLDEYNLQFGHRKFSARAKELGIKHIYQEFPDTHADTSYRYSVSLPMIANAIREHP